MSDKVIPGPNVRPRTSRGAPNPASSLDDRAVEGAGGGPHDPGMEERVAQLERDTVEIKATLGRLEPAIALISAQMPQLAEINARMPKLAEISAQMPNLATKSDIVSATGAAKVLGERLTALEGRFGRLERLMDTGITSAIGKSIGPWQLPAILAACAGLVIAAATLLGWVQGQHWLGR